MHTGLHNENNLMLMDQINLINNASCIKDVNCMAVFRCQADWRFYIYYNYTSTRFSNACEANNGDTKECLPGDGLRLWIVILPYLIIVNMAIVLPIIY